MWAIQNGIKTQKARMLLYERTESCKEKYRRVMDLRCKKCYWFMLLIAPEMLIVFLRVVQGEEVDDRYPWSFDISRSSKDVVILCMYCISSGEEYLFFEIFITVFFLHSGLEIE